MKSLIITIFFVLSVSLIFTACSPAPGSAPGSAPAPSPAAPSAASVSIPPPPQPPAPPPPATAAPTAADSSVGESYFPLPLLTPSDESTRLLSYTLSMGLQSSDFMPGIRRLLNTTSDMEGYLMLFEVSGHDMRTPPRERSARFTLRVPTENLAEFVIMIENNYNIWWLRQAADDETSSYEHSGLTLEDLRIEENQLLLELERTTESEDRLNIQSRLANVRRQIREHTANLSAIMDAVIYSTVTIELFEVFPAEISEPQSFNQRVSLSVSNSINALIAFMQGLVLIIIALTPVLIIMLAILGLALPIVRIVKQYRLRRNQASRSANSSETFDKKD